MLYIPCKLISDGSYLYNESKGKHHKMRRCLADTSINHVIQAETNGMCLCKLFQNVIKQFYIKLKHPEHIHFVQSMCMEVFLILAVADLGGGGVRGVQVHPPLAASNVFL